MLHENYSKKELHQTGLLSTKPKLYVCNVDEKSISDGNNYTKSFISKFGEKNTIMISADIENQINQLENEEKINYMKMINLNETGLNTLIKKGYELLELETFFTSGPEESRAWTVPINCTAPKAAGIIHTDFEKGFIRAETVSYEEFIKNRQIFKTQGRYDLIHKLMKPIRAYDLRCVDKSDCIIAYLDYNVAMTGTLEEIFLANRSKKPVLIFCKQGRKAVSDWLYGTLPQKYIFENMEDLLLCLEKVDNGEETDNSRWHFFDWNKIITDQQTNQ